MYFSPNLYNGMTTLAIGFIIKVGEIRRKKIRKACLQHFGGNRKEASKKPPTSNTLERKTLYKEIRSFIMPSC